MKTPRYQVKKPFLSHSLSRLLNSLEFSTLASHFCVYLLPVFKTVFEACQVKSKH